MFSIFKKIYLEYKELKYLAYHDSLTGLLNRNWLYKNISNIKAKYIYFIDINNLHVVNRRGHTFGDEYIKRIICSINHSGTLVRYAGDEFILFSDKLDEIETNKYYSVGFSEVGNDIINAINIADMNMILSKAKWKNKPILDDYKNKK